MKRARAIPFLVVGFAAGLVGTWARHSAASSCDGSGTRLRLTVKSVTQDGTPVILTPPTKPAIFYIENLWEEHYQMRGWSSTQQDYSYRSNNIRRTP